MFLLILRQRVLLIAQGEMGVWGGGGVGGGYYINHIDSHAKSKCVACINQSRAITLLM